MSLKGHFRWYIYLVADEGQEQFFSQQSYCRFVWRTRTAWHTSSILKAKTKFMSNMMPTYWNNSRWIHRKTKAFARTSFFTETMHGHIRAQSSRQDRMNWFPNGSHSILWIQSSLTLRCFQTSRNGSTQRNLAPKIKSRLITHILIISTNMRSVSNYREILWKKINVCSKISIVCKKSRNYR